MFHPLKNDDSRFRVFRFFTSVYGWGIDAALVVLVLMTFLFFLIRYAESPKMSDVAPVYEPSVDELFAQSIPDTGLTWVHPDIAYEQSVENPPALCAMRKQYCERVGHGYADFACDCFVYQYYDNFKTFTHEEDHFSVYYPPVWHRENMSVYDDEFIVKPAFQITRDDAVCTISYGSLRMDALERLGAYSTSTMHINSGEIRTIDVPFDGAITDEQAASGYTPWRAVAVPHFGGLPDDRGFLVSSGTKQPLVEACVSELRSMVSSRFDQYERATLDASSSGLLWLDEQIVWYKDDESASGMTMSLLFQPFAIDAQPIVRIAADVFERHPYPQDPLVVGSVLYFLDDGQLYALNVFESVERNVPLIGTVDQPVHAYLVRDTSIYYLQGNQCNEYMSKCSLNLRRFDTVTGADELLAQGVKGREVLGFDDAGNTLYMLWAEGDAGCTWGTFESYDMSRGMLSDVGEYGYCFDGEESVDDSDDLTFQEKVLSRVKGVSGVNHVILSGDGTIRVPEDSEWRDDFASSGNAVPMRAIR